MFYLTVVRVFGIIIISILLYVFLLWICGKKIPGKRKVEKRLESKDKLIRKTGIIATYQLLLVLLVMLSLLVIKYIVRGEL